MKSPFLGFVLALLALCPIGKAAETPKPNILLILADDLGFSDLGCYGGEIATPNLDALAKDGLRFTQFYNTARCWPSRAAILTGYYAQQVRRDTVTGVKSGASGTRPAWAPLLPELLRPLGYRSYHSGKWHVDGKPMENGFDHSYSLNDHDRHFAPKLHTEDDAPLPAVSPDSGYYSATAIATHAVKCLKEHSEKFSDRPFFEFLAFTSPHFPLHAPAEDIARYADVYLPGWDALRDARWDRMRSLGVGGTALSPVERAVGPPYAFPEAIAKLGPEEVNRPVPWLDLSASQRRFQARKMAVHAAMVDRMDREIGRVLEQIRAMGAMENTLVLFLSDNGASAEMMVRGDGHDPEAQCGTGATFLSIGPGWSSLANTPFRRHKTWVHEGGISTPLIAHWPRGIAARGELRHAPGHLVDLVPTILELAGGKPPQTRHGLPVPPSPGQSLVTLLARDASLPRESLWWLHEGNRALRAGDWKIVAAGKDSPWELYDLKEDRSESNNLAASHPEKVRELAALWQRQTADYTAQALKGATFPDQGWLRSGSFYILTSPEGANFPASASVEDFPVLVRLRRDFFNFAEARPDGADLRFATAAGEPLAFQIEEWDPAKGVASVWVRLPKITGNTRQEIRVYWGKADAATASDGSAVFNASNGHLAVWHMNGPVKDEVGSLVSKDVDTSSAPGMIGFSRHLAGGQGLFCGENIAGFPTGSAPHSTEAWFRAEKPNSTVVAWGNEHAQGKVVMQFRSPPHVNMDCYFSDANVRSGSSLALSEWVHVVHSYEKGDTRLYVNGLLAGRNTRVSSPLAVKSPAKLWIGGWYHNYDFVGDIDEVRVSKVARSADWVRLEYENQNPLQTLVGPIVKPGAAFSVSPAQAVVPEGTSATFTAEAGGAQKLMWILKRGSRETVVAVDQLSYTFEAGRVVGDESAVLRLKAVLANEVKTLDIPITVRERIQEPEFTLQAPAAWDGRSTVEVLPRISNWDAMRAKGAGDLRYQWTAGDLAVSKEVAPGKLLLTRAQNSGTLTVTATIDNGGSPVSRSVKIAVSEPKLDPWVARPPAKEEMPEDNQFYARDDRGEGDLFCNGTLSAAADSVYLKVFADDQPYVTQSAPLGPDKSYAFSVRLKAGLVRYRTEFGSVAAGRETVLRTATNLVCGDAYILQGQSNAVSTDWGPGEPDFRSDWIRSFGSMSGDPEGVRIWGNAVHRSRDAEKLQIGYWGMELGRRLVENHKIPVCILNGAVGGTRVDQHQPNPRNREDMRTIYGRLLWRARQARLTHGIRGILWHQGENDQGADGPTGRFGWETYRQYFLDLAAAWKQDFPNVRHYYMFQIWPKSCSMGIDGSDNRLREVQRNLPSAFSNMGIMSTLGIDPPGGCHFPAAGYSEFARLICPLVERDNYGVAFSSSITPPNLKRAYFLGESRESLALEFDQPVRWESALAREFYLDGEKGRVVSGSVSGPILTLKLSSGSKARTVTYLDSASWSQQRLLRGENGLAALTFCEVPILSGVSGMK